MYKAIKVSPRSEEAIRQEIGNPAVKFRDLQGFYLVVDTSYKHPWDFFPPELFEYHWQFLKEESEDRFCAVVERRR